jgi:hypothetical protein
VLLSIDNMLMVFNVDNKLEKCKDIDLFNKINTISMRETENTTNNITNMQVNKITNLLSAKLSLVLSKENNV